jgi:hypothetical protein
MNPLAPVPEVYCADVSLAGHSLAPRPGRKVCNVLVLQEIIIIIISSSSKIPGNQR